MGKIIRKSSFVNDQIWIYLKVCLTTCRHRSRPAPVSLRLLFVTLERRFLTSPSTRSLDPYIISINYDKYEKTLDLSIKNKIHATIAV